MTDPVRNRLVSLHRELIEFERRAYEKAHGSVSSGEFLQVVLRDPAFAWLAPLTAAIARLDELGGGEFAAKCAERAALSPDVAFAHAAALSALRAPAARL